MSDSLETATTATEIEVKTEVPPESPADTTGSAAAAALEAAASKIVCEVEAMVLSTPRPVPPRRLAQALGLVPMDDADAPAPTIGGEAVSIAAPATEGEPAETPKPAPRRRRKKASSEPDPEAIIRRAVELLNQQYEATDRAFRIEFVAGGCRVMTLAKHGKVVAALHGVASRQRLSKSAIETLAIIAYRQPVTRAQLEAIRGVACGEVLKTLLDRKLVTIAGRAEELGRPLLYATTKQFLAAFGLTSVKDLPSAAELGLAAKTE